MAIFQQLSLEKGLAAMAGESLSGFSALGAAFKKLHPSAASMLSTFGKFIPIVAALTVTIAGAVIGIDALTVSGKEAAKASDEAAQSFEDSANKVSGIKKELQDVKDKIDEINKQDKISPIDDANLQKLKTQKELLERDLAIEQKLYKLRQKQNAEQAATAIAQNGSESMDWRHISDNDLSRFGVTDEDRKRAGWKSTIDVVDDTGDMSTRWEYDLAQETAAMQSAYNRYVQQQNELKQQLADNGSLTKEQEKQKKQIDEYTQKLEEAIGQNVEELQTYRERLTNGAGQALKGHEDQVFQIDQVLDQFSGIERDPFEDLANHWKELQRLSKTDVGMQTAEMRHFLEVMSGKDLSTAGLEDLQQTWDKFKNLQTVDFSKMFTGDTQTNLQNFWKMVEKVNSEWAEFDEKTQAWKFNIDSVEELAQKLGISEDLVKNIIKLTNEAGAKIEVQNKDLNGQKIMDSSKAEKTLKKAGVIDKKYNINLETDDYLQLNKQINDISANLDKLRGKDGKINIDSKEGQAAYSIISQLYDKMIELSMQNNIAFHLDTSNIDEGSEKGAQAAKSLHDASVAIAEYQAALSKAEYNPKINVEEFEKKAKEACDAAAADLKAVEETDPKLAEKLTISSDQLDFSAITTALGNAVDPNIVFGQIQQSIAGMTQDDFTVVLGVEPEAIENYVAEEHSTKVPLSPDTTEVDTWLQQEHPTKVVLNDTKTGTMYDALNRVYTIPVQFDSGGVLPSPYGRGDFQGNAHAGGKWGTTRDEVALTSELGPEIVVDPKTGRWQTVGDKGAQFTRLPKGAIVFNHKQTEQLLKYGHINSRGKALIGGNAYPTGVQGTWNVGGTNDSGNGSKEQKDAAKETTKTAKEVAKNVKDSTDASKSAADELKEETSNLTDWVEKVLENINKKTEKYLAKAEKKAEAGNYSGAARQYRKAEAAYAQELSTQKDAESIYMAQANKVLQQAVAKGKITPQQSASIQDKVANGSMELSKVSESTKEVIDAYKEYYDKAEAAADATMEIYDKYKDVADKLHHLPLDAAAAKTEKLKDAFSVLDKKLELTYKTANKASIMREQMANARQQHAAVAKAYDTASDNYKSARVRVNESSDKALAGLSNASKARVTSAVANHQAVDITSLMGLTPAGKQALIDYNAALSAQQEALHNVKMSSLETVETLRELAAGIANTANESANKRIEKRHTNDDVIEAKYAVSNTKTKNRLLQKQNDEADADLADRKKAERRTKRGLDKSWNRVAGLAASQGKEYGQKLSGAGLDKQSKEYKDIVQYNAYIDAYKKAHHDTALAKYQTQQTQSDNAVKIFDNILADAERGAKSVLDAADKLESAYNDLDAQALKLMQEDPTLTYDQAVVKVMDATKSAYDDAAAMYRDMAAKLQEWLDANRDTLTPEAAAETQDKIDALTKTADDWTVKSQSVGTDLTTYRNNATQRAVDESQTKYDEAHRRNAQKQAGGKLLSSDDYTEELEAAIELEKKLDDRTRDLREQLQNAVPGSEEWKRLQNDLADVENQAISTRETISSLRDSKFEADQQPLNNELAALQNEQDVIQDRISLAQAQGGDASPIDYYKLIENSKQQVALLQQQRAELLAVLATLDATDAEYAEIQEKIWGVDDAIRQAGIDQAGWAKSATDSFTNGASGASEASSQFKDMLENLAKRHLNDIKLRLEKLGAKLNDIYNRMDLLKAKGVTPGYQNYIDAYSVNRERMQELQKEIKDLEFEYKKLRTYDEDPDGSQRLAAYQEWQSAVQEYNKLMAENMELARVTLRDSLLKPLQDEHDRLEHIANIFAGIADIIDDDMLFNQDGTVSKYGNMKTDLLAGQYQAARSEVQNYMDDIKVVNKLIAAGYYSSEEGSVRLNELQEKLIGAMKNQKSLASDLSETLKQANEQEIEQLGKIIDARKEALQAKKDYYDYDKNIRAQTKDIQVLQAQIAALEGLGDAESKAKRAKLQAQLTEAQQNLDDTVREHMFEISQDSLDKLQDTLQQSFEEEWDELSHDLDALIKYANNLADNTDPSAIESAMRDVFGTFDVDSTLAQFDDYFNTMMEPRHRDPYDTAVYDTVLNNIYDALCQLRDMGALSNGINPEAIKDDVTAAAIAASNVNNGVNTPVVQEDGGSVPKGEAPIVKWFREVFEDIGNWFGTLKSKIKIPGFASGVRRVSKSQLAWTQERGKEEWIVRPSDGAILTPMTKGSGVLPPDATSKLWALAQGQLPTMQMPKMPTPNFDFSETLSPVVNIDNSMTVEGSVDAAVIGDLKKFKEEQREDIYQYVSDRMFRGYIHSGGKRRI